MAEATFSLAVENLGNLLIQKADILRDVKGQVKELKEKLEMMQPFLRKAVDKKATDEMMGNWISQLREVAQDAEDVVETLIFKVDSSSNLAGHIQWACDELLSICRRLQKIIEIGKSYNFQILGEGINGERAISLFGGRMKINIPTYIYRCFVTFFKIFLGLGVLSSSRSEDVGWPRITTFWQNDEHVVGLEGDVELLLRNGILNAKRGISVAGIVGIGGIGKTTLARKLYNHADVVGRFQQCRAWVMISRKCNLEQIIKQLLLLLPTPGEGQAMTPDTIERLQLESLQVLLVQRLLGTPYFIVLDDVREHNHWEALAEILPDEGNASRLLITSRNRDVTRHAHYVHGMEALDSEHSWQLFLKTVFFRNIDQSCPEHLEDIGRAILRKCHNVPSAIKEAGSQLVEKHSWAEWEEVLNTMDLSLMSEEFLLSYHELPPKLKLCLLCLCLFKEGASIRAEKLVQVWIAGGMVPQGGTMNEIMEETGRGYLNDLISHNMVQAEDKTKDNRVKNCRIYDIFGNRSIKKAKEEIKLEILREEDWEFLPIHKPRHCAVYSGRWEFFHSRNEGNHLHTLFFHRGANLSGDYWNSFVLLRVLDLEGVGLQEFPVAICGLTGLRYLGLRGNYIRELHDSLRRLKNLKALDISYNFGIVVPNVIWEMDSLRHLYMSEIICKRPLRIDNLNYLQTLTYIPMHNWTYSRSSLQMMTSLRKLGIDALDEDSNVNDLFQSLAHLENLLCLNLKGSAYRRLPSLVGLVYLDSLTQLRLCGKLTTLPSAEYLPQNLSYLTLVDTSLDHDPMPLLAKLPKLLYLKLRNAYDGDRMVISGEGFPRLQILCIGDLRHLENIQVRINAMPMLRRLEISLCPNLENLLEMVRSIVHLRELKIASSTPTRANDLRQSLREYNLEYADIE